MRGGPLRHELPYREDNRWSLSGFPHGIQRIAPHDVAAEHRACRTAIDSEAALQKDVRAKCLPPCAQEVGAAGGNVVGENVDAVEGGEGAESLAAEAGCICAAIGLGAGGGEFAAENLDQKVAIAAGRFKEAGADVSALGGHQVTHIANEPIGGEDLPMVSHTFAGLDDFLFRFFGLGH